MSRRKERKANYDSKSSHDVFEGTSARTRPYSFEEIMFNRKNKKVSRDHEVEVRGKDDDVDQKLELLQTDKDEKGNKDSSRGVRHKHSENVLDVTSRKNERSMTIKLESLIVGKVGVSPAEPKVKSEVVDNTGNKETLGKRDAKFHKKIEDEQPYNNMDAPVGHSHLKKSMLKRRSGDYRNEKPERDVKRNERNPSDQKSNDDYLKAEHNRKIKYLGVKDRFDGEVEKARREDKTVHRNDLNRKHVVSKRDFELSDRRERRGSPPPLREQTSKRRRRSFSREHKRDRDQKLILHEVQKHTSSHRPNHAVSMSHSSKDRSGKHVSELDRSSKFTNGSAGNTKGHNESTDKLGGYSPRKRRAEDPIQSPPDKGISGKKRMGWDTPHTESDITMSGTLLPVVSVQSKLSKMPHSVGILAVSSSQPEPSLLNFNVQSAMHNEQIDLVQLTQSTQPMRRLIIENVPPTVSDKDVMDCLNQFLLPSSSANFIQGTRPCISCVIHNEKRQALVEFLTPEYAKAALSFKGYSLLGSDFKIRRPKDFVAVETAAHEKSAAAVNAVSDVVEDSPHKIFIGGISRNLSSKMLMEIASAFGPLKAYKFLFKNDVDEPRAFLQYVDQSVTAKACAGLNGMKLGGQTLTAIQATTNKSSYDVKRSPTYDIPETAKPLLADPTEVLVLKNVFDPESFSSLSQPEIEEVLEDVRLECARFGTVKSINFVACYQSGAASSEIIECGAAKIVPTESMIHDNDSGDSGTKVGSSRQLDKEDYEYAKSDNHNVEEPPNIEVVDSKNVDGEEKPVASDCTLSNETFSTRSEASDKPSSLINEINNEAEANIGGGELISVGDHKHSSSSSAEPGGSTGTIVETANEKRESRQLEGLGSVLLRGSICIEYRRSEAACMAAHCFNGRAFDNRTVSVEYLSLDLYRRKFPK